jgi:dethiobiotin synthetase
MTSTIVVTGTDTDVGKTVFCAALAHALGAHYWKPVQAGLEGETDSACVARLGGLAPNRIIPEAYRLKTPASPHFAAECDGIVIDVTRLTPPRMSSMPLVIEAAGGLMVPMKRDTLQIDIIAGWKLPTILVAATRLGTINHSLLSIEALKRRAIPVLGIAFAGDENADSERTIAEMGRVKRLGRLPRLDPLKPEALHRAFAENFNLGAVLGLGAGGP